MALHRVDPWRLWLSVGYRGDSASRAVSQGLKHLLTTSHEHLLSGWWIVARFDQLMALCDELEAKIEANQSTSQKFAEAVVAELAA